MWCWPIEYVFKILCPYVELFFLVHNILSLFDLDGPFRFEGLTCQFLCDGVHFFLLPAGCCASSAKLSINYYLSLFTLCLTCLQALLNSA